MSDKMQFYKPKQGDTASVVADGYDRNFEALDAVKADAEATAEALAGKADKVEGKDLMTDAEREKLAGIEPGANAYTLPAASASRLGGIKAGDNVTISADGTLSASAAPYELPRASATVLGGVKVGRNLSIDSEGRLNALGGGSASGGGVLVLPYVAPETDSATGAVTNSAAFVEAWGGILSEYLAAPDVHTLYMDADVGDGMILRMPCALLKVEESENTATYYLSAFEVFNIPATESATVSSKATVFAGLVCNTAGALQEVLMYISEGMVTPGGQPNLLGDANTLVIDLSSVDINDPDQLKAAFEPVVSSLQANIAVRIYVIEAGHAASQLPAFCSRNSDNIAIWSIMVHNYIAEDPGDNLAASVTRYWCSLADGQLQSVTCKISSGWLATMSMLADMSFDPASGIEDTDKMLVGGRDNNAHSVTARQLSDYVQSRAPQPQYRNLCLNSRGDNLNGWGVGWGTSTLTLDYAKFGYPVLCVETTIDGVEATPIKSIAADDNIPAIREIIGNKGGTGLPHDIVISYDIYSESSTTVYEGCHVTFPHMPYTAGTKISANKWHRIVSKVPSGTVWDYFMLGYIRDAYMGHKMYIKNIQIEYGTEATPYCYDPTLPQSLTEQVVPGEFWLDTDGVSRQVYIRTFRGTMPKGTLTLLTGVDAVQVIGGYMVMDAIHHMPFNVVFAFDNFTTALKYLANVYVSDGNVLVYSNPAGSVPNSPYVLTIKYTKS